jgi:glycosyltransferase involved in cell wall biosynthesis
MSSDANLIARLDADDTWHPTKLEKQVEFLEKNPDIHILGTQILRVSPDNFSVLPEQVRYPTEDTDIRRMLFSGNNAIAHPSVVFRPEVILRTGGYDNTYPIAEDYHLWLKAAQWFNFANLEDTFVLYTVSHNPKYNPKTPQLCCMAMRTALEFLHKPKE